MFKSKPSQTELAIMEMLKAQQTPAKPATDSNGLYSFKNLNALAIAAVIGLGAFIWTGVTEQPQKNADSFALIQTQSAEVRTTLLELKTTVVALNGKFDVSQRDNAETRSGVDKNSAEIEGLKKRVSETADRVTQIERDTR